MDLFKFREMAAESGVDTEVEELAYRSIGAAIEVHRIVGPGFPETVYRNALSYELTLQGIAHTCEAPRPIHYKGMLVCEGRMDILVEGRLVLELKSVVAITEAHRAQLISYLQATRLQLGLIINFNVPILRDGIKRVINTYIVKNLRV